MTWNKGTGTTIRKAAYSFYSAAQRVLVPGLQNSQYAYKDTLRSYLRPNVRWLDLGCGHDLLPAWMPSGEQEQIAIVQGCGTIIGIDLDHSSVRQHRAIQDRVVGDIQRLPFQDHSFELVTANVVLEHVQDPNVLLAEVCRVLRPAGIFVFHTPNLLAYATLVSRLLPEGIKLRLIDFLQDRKEADVFRTYYRINTPGAVKSLAQQNGFHVLELRLVESSAQTVMLGPLVICELMWIRLLRLRLLKNLRTNIIAVLRKPGSLDHLPGTSAPTPS